MYSKEEAAKLKREFWTAYGQYMSPIPSSEGEKINWINYRTGEKYIHLKTQADKNLASVELVFDHPDVDIRSLHIEQFNKFDLVFRSEMNEEWLREEAHDRFVVYKTLEGYSIFNKDHWPQIISFFKQQMIALDAFWNNVKYAFEELR